MTANSGTGDLDLALTDSWSDYWRSGTLHSCACAYRGNYEGATATFWNTLFSQLPAAAVVVDVGTGNGAIPLLAKAVSDAGGLGFDIHGVDLASIDPRHAMPGSDYAGIQFHPATSMTALPFGDGSVDCVTGQYALEYAPLDDAVAEIVCVLKPGGIAAFVLHDRESVVLHTCAEQLSTCELLFERTQFFARARDMCSILANAPTPLARKVLATDPRAQVAREQFNAAAAQLSAVVATLETPDILQNAMGMIGEAIQATGLESESRVLERIASCEAALRGEWQRLKALDRAALDVKQVEALADRFRDNGCSNVDVGRIEVEPGSSMGWSLVARR